MSKKIQRYCLSVFMILLSLSSASFVKAENNDYLYIGQETIFYVSPYASIFCLGKDLPYDNSYYRQFELIQDTYDNPITKIESGKNHVVYLTRQGSLYGYGNPNYNQIPKFSNDENYGFNKATKICDDIMDASAGDNHTLFVKIDGSGWSMGNNQNGQLGIENTKSEGHELKLKNIVKILARKDSSFAINRTGDLYVWGLNDKGQLGTGDKKTKYSPVKILSNITDIWSSGNHSFAKCKNGTIYAWGDNRCGQLGTNKKQSFVLKPVKIGKYRAVSAGENHTLFISCDNTLLGCGSNANYQLGLDDAKNYTKIIKLMDKVARAQAGEKFSIAIMENDHWMLTGEPFFYQTQKKFDFFENPQVKFERENPILSKLIKLMSSIFTVPLGEDPFEYMELDIPKERDYTIPLYPDSFGGLYIENDQLILNIATDRSTKGEQEKMKSIALQHNIKYCKVKYSINQLSAMMDYFTDLKNNKPDLEIISIVKDEKQGKIIINVYHLTKEKLSDITKSVKQNDMLEVVNIDTKEI